MTTSKSSHNINGDSVHVAQHEVSLKENVFDFEMTQPNKFIKLSSTFTFPDVSFYYLVRVHF